MPHRRKMTHAEISVLVHATEDAEKIEKAIRNLIPMQGKEVQLVQTRMGGHHGNPILRFEAELTARTEAFEALHLLLSRLSSIEEELLQRELHEHLDLKGSFYLRFDKQQAFLGNANLGSDDPISVKVRLGFRPCSLDELRAWLKKETKPS